MKHLKTLFALCLAASIALAAWPLSLAADTAVFTETFSSTSKKDTVYTSADWNTSQGALKLPLQAVNTLQINPDVARDSYGYLYVVWLDQRSGTNIYMQKYNTSGVKQWSSDIKVNVNSFSYLSGWETRPHITIDASNNIYVTWSGYVPINGWGMSANVQKFNTSGTRLWANDAKANATYSAEYLDSDIACDSSGNIYVAYNRYGPQGTGIILQKLNPSGTRVWTSDKLLFSGTGYPQLIKMWTYNYFYVSNGTYVNSLDVNGNFRWSAHKSWGGSHSIACDKYNYLICIMDNADKLYFMRTTHTGAQSYSSPKLLTSTATTKKYVHVCVDTSNYVYATWQDYTTMADMNIMAQKFTRDGAITWPAPVKVDGSGNTQLEANSNSCAPDYAGGVFAVWNSNSDIYANIITSAKARKFSNDLKINTDTAGGTYLTPRWGQSLSVDAAGSSDKITAATLTAAQTLNGQTVKYYLTSNNGTNWYQITPGAKYTFPAAAQGSDLKWKAELSTTNNQATPSIDTISISYDYTVSIPAGIFPYRMYWDTTWSDPLSGWMGSSGGSSLTCNTAYTGTTPTYGSSNCTMFTYDKTKESWAGIYSLRNGWSGPGINLTGNKRLSCMVKSNVNGVVVKFGMGATSSGDTAQAYKIVTLTTSWQEIVIDLSGKNLSSINGLWYFSIASADNSSIPNPVTFYVDTVMYDEVPAN